MEDFVTNKTMIPLNEIDNFEYIDGNEIFDIDKEKIKYEIIKLLIKKGYKNENEKNKYKSNSVNNKIGIIINVNLQKRLTNHIITHRYTKKIKLYNQKKNNSAKNINNKKNQF